jgi:hypothetical protein
MHVIERGAQPDKFGTIPDAMWWAIVTLGTIGYGDVVPVTALGRIVASITIFVGLIMIALPIGIIATAFAEEIHRRDFVVTWGMVARVPLFAELEATEIADIMRLLHAQQVEAGDVITRRGELAHSMYFIADGEVEIGSLESPSESTRWCARVLAARQSRRRAILSPKSWRRWRRSSRRRTGVAVHHERFCRRNNQRERASFTMQAFGSCGPGRTANPSSLHIANIVALGIARRSRSPQACCGVVSNGCWDASALTRPAFDPSAAPLPPPKPAIACTS